jgi:hypothetical protein
MKSTDNNSTYKRIQSAAVEPTIVEVLDSKMGRIVDLM